MWMLRNPLSRGMSWLASAPEGIDRSWEHVTFTGSFKASQSASRNNCGAFHAFVSNRTIKTVQ